jgi:hypothetical protein
MWEGPRDVVWLGWVLGAEDCRMRGEIGIGYAATWVLPRRGWTGRVAGYGKFEVRNNCRDTERFRSCD